MKKISYGIWGQLGPKKNVSDGQAIKTREFVSLFEERVRPLKTRVLSTYNWKKRPLSFFVKSILLFFNNKKIIIMPANNGFKIIIPLFNFLSKIFKRDLYYVVIGGFLYKLLSDNQKYLNMLMKYKGIYVETKGMVKDLEKFGLSNVYYLPNFKKLNRISSDLLIEQKDDCIRLCSLSRITKSKGIIEAIEAVVMCNDFFGSDRVTLDFYGAIDETFKPEFYSYLDKYTFLSYKGIVKYDETVSVIKNYFALLFPTYYHGEGFAGIIIDAYHSAIPIIATDWLYNSDLIQDGKNGFLVPTKNARSIFEKILILVNNRKKHLEIKINNYYEAEKYSPNVIMDNFIDTLK